MRILVPVDDMPYTLASLHSMLHRTWPPGTLVTLCRVIEDGQVYVNVGNSPDDEHSRRIALDFRDHFQKAEHWLNELAAVMQLDNCSIEAVLMVGNTAEQISHLANQRAIDYIVIGSHDRTPAERAWLGTIAASVADSVSCSVEIVRPRELHKLLLAGSIDFSAVENIDYAPRRIILAIDFSENSLGTLRWLSRIGCSANSIISLVAVDPPVERGIVDLRLSNNPHLGKPSRFDLSARLRKQAKLLGKSLNATPCTTKVLKGKPASALLDYANAWDADLIVMGAHGHANNADSPVGSVTREVIDGARCSVVAINARTIDQISFDWKTRG